MESEWSESDFGFAFNKSNFSDRILRIEIITDPIVDVPPPHSDSVTTIDDWTRYCERRRKNGDEAANSNDSNWIMDCSTATYYRVKTLHISSPILAAKSPFFYKLFSNGMKESEHRHVTLRINASEEAAFMELLNFMYRNTLNITTPAALLDLLMAADKFEVSSCMRHCRRLPMTLDFALFCAELPMAYAVQPLTDAAKQYLASRFKDVTKFDEEFMALPLHGIEAILASDDLKVQSEDVLCGFVIKWARKHYNRLKERREVLGTQLARLIRFPCMSFIGLKQVLTVDDVGHKDVSKLVIEALSFKSGLPKASLYSPFVERVYTYHPIKVIKLDIPRRQHSVVYWDLKREVCATLLPSGPLVWSEKFRFGGQRYFLVAESNKDTHCFELFLGMSKGSVGSAKVNCKFSARCRPREEFVDMKKARDTFTGGKFIGHRNLFNMPWTSFMAEDCKFFINGVLHLKVSLSIRD
ncbi:BTB/POZ domain-containing protein POB1-like [Lotus japonicus]|uniref:BTB/POZ domain-containing protein POB1-like n=1 Tax=Lotus japonicus TaxID=34305 RepID=UPI0025907105|nr:BTB/POZ domain-containing protein POB1-like [Lotus japonicus]